MPQSTREFLSVEGRHQITSEWSINLDRIYKRRLEDGDLVLWCLGVTNWIAVWGMKDGETAESTMEWLKADQDPSRIQKFEDRKVGYLCWAYLLNEKTEEDHRWALYSFMVGTRGYVQMATYFDHERDLEAALGLWMSLEETKPG